MAKVYSAIMSLIDKASEPALRMEERLAKLSGEAKSAEQNLSAIGKVRIANPENIVSHAHANAPNIVMSSHQKLWQHLTRGTTGEFGKGLDEGKKKYGEISKTVGELGNRVTDVLPMLGGLGAIGSVAGLLELVHSTAEAVEQLHNLSVATGVAMPNLQALEFAAQRVGVSNDTLGAGLEKLNLRIGKSLLGQDKKSASLFKQLGINLRDTSGHVEDASQVFPQLETAFQRITDPAMRATVAVQLFGKGGQDMLPLLTEGPKALAAAEAQFKKFGYGFTPKDQEGLDKFNSSWKDLSLSVSGLTNQVSAELAPVLAPMLEGLATWISLHRQVIAADIVGAVKSAKGAFDEWLVSMGGIKGVKADLIAFGHDVHWVFEAIGGLAGIAAIAGSVIGIKLFMALRSVAIGIKVLGTAMFDNPILLVLAGIVIASYELYEHWGWISKELSGMWKQLSANCEIAFGPIIKIFEKLEADMKWVEDHLPGGGSTPDGPGAEKMPDGRIYHHMAKGGYYTQPLSAPVSNTAWRGEPGKVQVNVDFGNVPDGVKVRSRSSGMTALPKMNVGRNRTLAV